MPTRVRRPKKHADHRPSSTSLLLLTHTRNTPPPTPTNTHTPHTPNAYGHPGIQRDLSLSNCISPFAWPVPSVHVWLWLWCQSRTPKKPSIFQAWLGESHARVSASVPLSEAPNASRGSFPSHRRPTPRPSFIKRDEGKNPKRNAKCQSSKPTVGVNDSFVLAFRRAPCNSTLRN